MTGDSAMTYFNVFVVVNSAEDGLSFLNKYMLLKIATLVGFIWFGYLIFDVIRWSGKCRKHKTPLVKCGYDEREVCIPCFDESKGRLIVSSTGHGPSPSWLKNVRDFSLNRFFSKQKHLQELFDGIIRQEKRYTILVSEPCITKSWRYMKIPVKGGEEDMAKGKSPVKEKKKPKKSKKK